MDTTPPDFTGTADSITVSLSGDYLVATWTASAFSDSEELFSLDYQFAIGKLFYQIQLVSNNQNSIICKQFSARDAVNGMRYKKTIVSVIRLKNP